MRRHRDVADSAHERLEQQVADHGVAWGAHRRHPAMEDLAAQVGLHQRREHHLGHHAQTGSSGQDGAHRTVRLGLEQEVVPGCDRLEAVLHQVVQPCGAGLRLTGEEDVLHRSGNRRASEPSHAPHRGPRDRMAWSDPRTPTIPRAAQDSPRLGGVVAAAEDIDHRPVDDIGGRQRQGQVAVRRPDPVRAPCAQRRRRGGPGWFADGARPVPLRSSSSIRNRGLARRDRSPPSSRRTPRQTRRAARTSSAGRRGPAEERGDRAPPGGAARSETAVCGDGS